MANKRVDKRIKLLPEEKELIYSLYTVADRDVTKSGLARLFGVSRRTIDFIVNPEALKRNRKIAEDRGGWRKYYDKEVRRRHAESRRREAKQLKEKGNE